MNILLSGGSGFLGNIIKANLQNYTVKTIGRSDSDFNFCLTKSIPSFSEKFDFVIHCAGKAHSLPKTVYEAQEFFKVNVMGTKNLMTALEGNVPRGFIYISSVAVYGHESGLLISESSELLATDPYGASKKEAEFIVQDWCTKNNVICSILRLPLIAGPNPPGNLRSMIKAIKNGFYFNIKDCDVNKSIVLADDVSFILPKVAQVGGIYNLTDGHNPSFKELSEVMALQLGKGRPKQIPLWLAKLFANIGDAIGESAPINSSKLKKITNDLTFDDSKARRVLNWNPTPVIKGFKIR